MSSILREGGTTTHEIDKQEGSLEKESMKSVSGEGIGMEGKGMEGEGDCRKGGEGRGRPLPSPVQS